MSLAGLILAGGASIRMGRPKALLEIGGETFIDRLIGLLRPHCHPVAAVLGHQAAEIQGAMRRSGDVKIVINPSPERGMLSSLQCGLREFGAGVDGVIFTPVDFPAVRPETVAGLSGLYRERPPFPLLAIPRYGGRHGHPVCIAAQLIPEFLALDDEARASDVIHRHASAASYLDVEDPGILFDVDSPRDYQRLLAGTG